MRYLFVDNFRGFKNTVIPIKDVNFFVGENSTGKTSILHLINLISQFNFWAYQKFDIEGFELGNYDDIVSVNSRDKSYFRFGVIEITSKPDRKPQHRFSGFLVSYKKAEGLPIISRYTYARENVQTHVKLSNEHALCKAQNMPDISDNIDTVKGLFLDWADEHRRPRWGYVTVKGYESAFKQNLLIISTYVEEALVRRKKIRVMRGVFLPRLVRDVICFAPIRTTPLRTYDKYDVSFSPSGEHTPYLIKKLLYSSKTAERFISYVKAFGEESGLFENVTIKRYGRAVTDPFELDIVLNRSALKIHNVGYGISQILPIIVEFFEREEGTWFALQQPEIHLHPKAHVALGNLLFLLATEENKRFIIETHVDYIIDSFRRNYRQKGITKIPNAQVIFFERTTEGNIIHTIDVLKNGALSEKQPDAYRNFFLQHQMKMLGY